MLQSSEYFIKDFIFWYLNVSDFRNVEKRKKLVYTLKIKLLLFLYCLTILTSIYIFSFFIGIIKAIILFAVIYPQISLLVILFWALFLEILINPIKKLFVLRAKYRLSQHKGIKIAIAGSYGKTSIKEILNTVLSPYKKVKCTPDNHNTPIGIARFINTLEMDEDVLIFEMGEYFKGDIKYLSEFIDPNIGIITGINEAHLDKFGNVENTKNAIFELADFLKNKTKTKLFCNIDSRYVFEKSKSYKDLIFYGKNGVLDFVVENPSSDLSGTNFILKDVKGNGLVIKSKLLGLHQVGPLSLASYVSYKLGISISEIEISIKNTKAFAHRLELKEDSGGVLVIDDSYNGNPDGVKCAINFLGNIKNKRRFYITPGLVEMGQKSEEIHKEIGRLLAEAKIEKVVLIKNSVSKFIEDGINEYKNNHKIDGENYCEIIYFDSALDLFKNLPKQTANNDLLLYQNDWPDNYF